MEPIYCSGQGSGRVGDSLFPGAALASVESFAEPSNEQSVHPDFPLPNIRKILPCTFTSKNAISLPAVTKGVPANLSTTVIAGPWVGRRIPCCAGRRP